MIKKRVKLIEQKEDYRVCDCCGDEIELDGIVRIIIFKGAEAKPYGVNSAQNETYYDCCDSCRKLIINENFKKKID